MSRPQPIEIWMLRQADGQCAPSPRPNPNGDELHQLMSGYRGTLVARFRVTDLWWSVFEEVFAEFFKGNVLVANTLIGILQENLRVGGNFSPVEPVDAAARVQYEQALDRSGQEQLRQAPCIRTILELGQELAWWAVSQGLMDPHTANAAKPPNDSVWTLIEDHRQ